MKRLPATLLVLSLVAAGCAKKTGQGSAAALLVPSDALAYVAVPLDPPSDQKRLWMKPTTRWEDLSRTSPAMPAIS